MAFTPLVLSTPPSGYELTSARYYPGDGGFGIARYISAAHNTQLEVTIRNSRLPIDTLTESGRQTWPVGDRTVYDDGQGGGCLSDFCSVGLQWDDASYVSISWVDHYGGHLAPGSTIEALVELVPFLTEQDTGWEARADEQSYAGPVLIPVGDRTIVSSSSSVYGAPGSQMIAVRAPDGSMQVAVVTPAVPAPDGHSAADHPDARSIGGLTVLADDTSQRAIYQATTDCWVLNVADGGAGSGTGAWRPEMVELFQRLVVGEVPGTSGGDIATFDLATGWDLLGQASSAPVYELTFELLVDREPVEVSLLQTRQGGFAAALGYGAHTVLPHLEPITFLGEPAWLGTDPAEPDLVRVIWNHENASFSLEAHAVELDDLQEVLADHDQWTYAHEWPDELGGEPELTETPQLATGCQAPSLTALPPHRAGSG